MKANHSSCTHELYRNGRKRKLNIQWPSKKEGQYFSIKCLLFVFFVDLRYGFLTAVANYGFYYRNSCHAILDCSHGIALFKSSKKIFRESKKFRFNILCCSGSELRTFAFKSTLHTDQCICAVTLCFSHTSSKWRKALFSLFFQFIFHKTWEWKALHFRKFDVVCLYYESYESHKFSQILLLKVCCKW